MSNETCTVTIADIYGAEWWLAHKETVDCEWEWSFGVTKPGDQVLNICCQSIPSKEYGTAIILHRRKSKLPTLREVYGVDEVMIPAGWEWTGEWRVPVMGDKIRYCGGCGVMACCGKHKGAEYRLILRERPKKVWYRAEENTRVPRSGDWYFSYGSWHFANTTGDAVYLCATRHEEIDQTVQVVTQADVDGVVTR